MSTILRRCLLLICLCLLSLSTACSYGRDRGNDALDIFRFNLSIGLGVSAKITDFAGFGLGGNSIASGLNPNRSRRLMSDSAFTVTGSNPFATLAKRLKTGKNEGPGAPSLVSWLLFTVGNEGVIREESRWCTGFIGLGYQNVPEKKLSEKFEVRVGVAFLFGVGFGFNPVELMDFFLGFTTLDICQDDGILPYLHYLDTAGVSKKLQSQAKDAMLDMLPKNAVKMSPGQLASHNYLQAAVMINSRDVLGLMLEKGADINDLDGDSESALHKAAKNDNIGIVLFLLKRKAKSNIKNSDGETPLHLAAKNGSTKIIEYLVNTGADVNAKNDDDRTPLHLATLANQKYAVECLLGYGADAKIVDEYKMTAFAMAMSKRNTGMQDLLRNPSEIKALDKKKMVLVDPTTKRRRSAKIDERWAVIVGISKYKYPSKEGFGNLKYADKDADAIEKVLLKQGWKSSNIKKLTNSSATKKNITDALESWLQRAGRDDLILLYWSGHGVPNPSKPEKVYFACYDTDYKFPSTGYDMGQVADTLKRIDTRNVVVMADACHAGKLATRGEKGLAIAPYLNSLKKSKRIPLGWVWMTASRTQEKAVEIDKLGHGLFTYVLLEALSGKASTTKKTSLGQIKKYLERELPNVSQKYMHYVLKPYIIESTADPEIYSLSLQVK